jgi:hypothetical protein
VQGKHRFPNRSHRTGQRRSEASENKRPKPRAARERKHRKKPTPRAQKKPGAARAVPLSTADTRVGRMRVAILSRAAASQGPRGPGGPIGRRTPPDPKPSVAAISTDPPRFPPTATRALQPATTTGGLVAYNAQGRPARRARSLVIPQPYPLIEPSGTHLPQLSGWLTASSLSAWEAQRRRARKIAGPGLSRPGRHDTGSLPLPVPIHGPVARGLLPRPPRSGWIGTAT